MTYKDKAFYDSSPPCTVISTQIRHPMGLRHPVLLVDAMQGNQLEGSFAEKDLLR